MYSDVAASVGVVASAVLPLCLAADFSLFGTREMLCIVANWPKDKNLATGFKSIRFSFLALVTSLKDGTDTRYRTLESE